MIKVFRASGLPVNLDNLKNFQNDMQQSYDKIMLREGIDVNKGIFLEKDQAIRMQKLLDRVERILKNKYPAVETWDVITSKKAWKALVDKCGPIMIAKDAETKDLVYVIYDIET